VAGFYGRSQQGSLAILGRVVSDFTATLVGCALGADEIWMLKYGVDGIKTTDPRLWYAFNRRSGRTFVVPMDHGISMGPVPGPYDVCQTVEQMAGTGVNGVVVHKGPVRSIAPWLRQAPDLGLIVHLCGSTAQAPDPNEKQLVCTMQEAPAFGAAACRSTSTSARSRKGRHSATSPRWPSIVTP
jgi:hypothetical protein